MAVRWGSYALQGICFVLTQFQTIHSSAVHILVAVVRSLIIWIAYFHQPSQIIF